MATGQWGLVARDMNSLFEGGTSHGVPAGRLLERFVRCRDGLAFEAIVARHGPMVMGVCKRVLGDRCDAEDAFQATFLTLVRKAGTIGDGDLLETWLYKVAIRVAVRARTGAARRRTREQSITTVPEALAVSTLPGAAGDEIRPVLDEEIGRLPEKYRAPLVLFYLQGLSQAETACRLGCPTGTVGSRLARARERLHGRLLRRGLAPSAGALVAVLSAKASSAAVPSALLKATLRAALPAAAVPAIALATGVSRAMAWTGAMTAAVLGTFSAIILGTATLSQVSPKVEVGPGSGAAGVSRPVSGPARAEGRSPEPIPAEGMIDAKAVRAIRSGLAWLAGQQRDDGSFGMGSMEGSIGNTSLAALALMAADSDRDRGPYHVRVEKALRYVMRNAGPAGFLSVPGKATHGPMYHHAFGVLFLAEAYVRSKRPEIRDTLEKAVRLIVDSQNDEGGWRYQPIRADADLSVTVCQLNALRAARGAGLEVPAETIDAGIRYVKKSQNPDGGFRYMLQGGASAFPRSAGGLMALLSAGGPDDKGVRDGLAYLGNYMKDIKLGLRFSHYYYGQYYAAQAMRLRGGEDWNAWYAAIRSELVARQNPLGYWPDSIGNDYGTAMALIILQMPRSRLLLSRDEKKRERDPHW